LITFGLPALVWAVLFAINVDKVVTSDYARLKMLDTKSQTDDGLITQLQKQLREAEKKACTTTLGKPNCPTVSPQPLGANEAALQSKNDELSRELEVRKHSFSGQDFENMRFVFQGFAGFRKAIGPDAHCLVKVTSSADKVDREIAGIIQQLSRLASNCDSSGPGNFDSEPDLEKEALAGSIANTIILHASRGQKGADAIFNDLGFVMHVKRSYDIPKDSKENFVWLQFGAGTHFNN